MQKVAAAALAAVILTACGGVQDPAPESAEGGAAEEAESTGFGHEEIGIGESLAQIRGHHLVGLELYESDPKAALVHFRHPIDEILDVLSAELEEHGGSPEDVESALQETVDVAESGGDAADLEAAVAEAAAVVREAEAELLGPDATSPAYRGSVVGALLKTAAHEYEEAVAGGKGVSLVVEYEDAYGFSHFAQETYETDLAAAVEDVAVEEAEEIEEAFEVLNDALAEPTPPAQPVDAEEVEVAAELVGHELEETVDAQPLEEVEPAEVADNIEALLDEVLAAYEAGEEEEASELAAEAYLENYEVIEADVIEYAPDINEELEPLLGAELRKQIDAGVPADEIEAMIQEAKKLLAEALEVLEAEEEEHS